MDAENPFPFMQLPLELRQAVYQIHLGGLEQSIALKPPSWERDIPTDKAHMALACTCKAISEEFLNFLYGRCTFVLRICRYDTLHLDDWFISKTTLARVQLLRLLQDSEVYSLRRRHRIHVSTVVKPLESIRTLSVQLQLPFPKKPVMARTGSKACTLSEPKDVPDVDEEYKKTQNIFKIPVEEYKDATGDKAFFVL